MIWSEEYNFVRVRGSGKAGDRRLFLFCEMAELVANKKPALSYDTKYRWTRLLPPVQRFLGGILDGELSWHWGCG